MFKHLFICLLLLCSVINGVAQSGSVRDITWELSADTLTIGGTGSLIHYAITLNVRPPWYNYRTQIKYLEIKEGVVAIGQDAFYGCSNLTSISLPESLTEIYSSFGHCSAITAITCYALKPPSASFSDFSSIDKNACILYIPEGTRELYQIAAGWRDFAKMVEFAVKLRKITVNLPDSIENNLYKNLSIGLHRGTTQLFSLTTGNSGNYPFYVPEGIYNVKLKSRYGDLLGQIDDIVVNDRDTTVHFSSLAPLYVVRLDIAEDQNLSGRPAVRWYGDGNTLLQQGDSIVGVVAGMKLKYGIVLNEEWGKVYQNPPVADYTVAEGNNTIPIQLQKIPETTIQGIIKNENGSVLTDVLVSITQLLNGKFSTTKTVKPDHEGKFSAVVANDSTEITISSPDYLSQTIRLSNFDEGTDLGIIALSPITGARIMLNLTYTRSVPAGEIPVTENWYSDHLNVCYSLFNRTQNHEIGRFAVQYPEIILLEPINAGDEIEIAASSRTNIFNPTRNSAILDEKLRAPIQLNIVQQGYVKAEFSESKNRENSGVIYDADGKIVSQFDYVNRTFECNALPDGFYSLVSMAKGRFFNSVHNLSALSSTGLIQDVDYILQTLTVKSGEITEVNVPDIPMLDESRFYYTGSKTLFSINKTIGTVGNYLTLRAEVDFKEEYATRVSNLKLIVDIPEACIFEANSVKVGDALSGGYFFDDNRLTISLEDYSDIIRFCITPVLKGNYAPNAFIQFDLEGKTITQPIGSAIFTVENLSISVPKITAKKEITVHGIVPAKSDVKVYDGDALIGQTQAMATGDWFMQCDLHKPYALSYHNIHAEVITSQGLILQTETKRITHNISAIEPANVTMIHTSFYGEEKTVFDFLNPSQKKLKYNFYVDTNFTFRIELTKNDPDLVSDVTLHVLTTAGTTRVLPATYDRVKQVWVAAGKFDAYHLPVNVSVNFSQEFQGLIDVNYLSDIADAYIQGMEATTKEEEDFNLLVDKAVYLLGQLEGTTLPDTTVLNRFMDELVPYSEYLDSLGEDDPIDDAYFESILAILNNYTDYISQFEINIDIGDYELPEDFTLDDTVLSIDFDSFFQTFDLNADSVFNQAFTSRNIKVRTDAADPNISYIDMSDIGYHAKQTISACDNLNEESLVSEGYDKIGRTDGTFIYEKKEEGVHTTVDFTSNTVSKIEYYMDESEVEMALRRTSADNTDGQLNSILNTATSAISNLAGAIYDFDNWVFEQIDLLQIYVANSAKELAKMEAQMKSIVAQLKRNNDELDMLNGKLNHPAGLQKNEKERILRRIGKLNKEIIKANKNLHALKVNSANLRIVLNGYSDKLTKFVGYRLMIKGCQIVDIGLTVYNGIREGFKIWGLRSEIGKMAERCPETKWYAETKQFELSQVLAKDIFVHYGATIGIFTIAAGKLLIAKPTLGATIPIALTSIAARYEIDRRHEMKMTRITNNTEEWIRRFNTYWCDDEGGDDGNDYSHLPATPIMDPSGYVYEAVPSNRMQGVMTTVYFKTSEGDVTLWDAGEYEQENPMFTNEYGEYGWDVPAGLWQVKYEKEGYQTVFSEWLPVPPPQMDVNMAKVQPVQPEVIRALGYESGIVIEFDKFMLPALMTTEYISVTRNGESVLGVIELLNEETGAGGSFASKVRFIPDILFQTSDEVILTVKRAVKSYADIEMAEDFVRRVEIQKEMTSIMVTPVLEIALHDNKIIDILVEPTEAAAGKRITARSVSPSIATVTPEAVLDAEGKAVLRVTGELPGTTTIYVSVDETEIAAETVVRVGLPAPMERLLEPFASIPSGSTVEKNTMLTLSSEIADATIYYTLDGSTPSATSGLKYMQPVVITGNLIIRAIAVKEGMLNSEIVVFYYYVNDEVDIPAVKSEAEEWMIVSPNPVRVGEPCVIRLDMSGNSLRNSHIAVYSVLGEKVYENHRLMPVMEIQNLKQGYYIIKLWDVKKGEHQTKKVLVMN